MVEDLDYLLAGDHLLDIAVDRAQSALLADKEACGFSCHDLSDVDNQTYGQEHDKCQNPGGINQIPQYYHQCHCGRHTLGNGLGDDLTQGIDITRVTGHDIASRMAVKIAQRQTLHLGKQLVSNRLLNALGYAHHQIIKEKRTQNTAAEDTGQLYKIRHQRAKICGSILYHGQNILIHQGAQRTAALSLRHRSSNDTDEDEDQNRNIFFHITEQPHEGLHGIGCLAAIAAHSTGTWH